MPVAPKRQPRPPRLRAVAPPASDVAREALALPRESATARWCRAHPAIGGLMRQLEALELFDRDAAELGVGQREALAAGRVGASQRSVRRWRVGR